jgi:hypothetical protein
MWPFDKHDQLIATLERELDATRRVNESLMKVINELMVTQRALQDSLTRAQDEAIPPPTARQQIPRRVQFPRLKQQLEREASDKFFKSELDKAEHAAVEASRPE